MSVEDYTVQKTIVLMGMRAYPRFKGHVYIHEGETVQAEKNGQDFILHHETGRWNIPAENLDPNWKPRDITPDTGLYYFLNV